MKQRTILLISFGRPFGGAEVYSGRLAALLRADAKFYALCGDQRLALYLEGAGVTIIPVPSSPRATFWWKLSFIVRGMVRLPFLRNRYGIDAVWIQGFREAFFLPWARLLGYTVIATMHLTLKPSISQISQVFYPYLLLSTHKIICVSCAVKNSLPRFVPQTKLAVVENWVSESSPPGEHKCSNRRHLQLLYVGRLVAYKGASLIIEAMHHLQRKGWGDPIALTIVGDGEYRANLEDQAKGLNVHFTGFIHNPRSAYKAADIFINPTRGPEGSSLVTLEAMSHGLPCILSDIEVNKELTLGGESAILFRAGDASDLCSKIEIYVSDPHLMKTFQRRALDAVASKFSPEIARGRYIQEIGLSATTGSRNDLIRQQSATNSL